MMEILFQDGRGKISYVDVVMSFSVLVVLVGVAPWLWQIIGMINSQVDPLTGALLTLFLPLIFVGLLLSMGVSARSQ